jgi:hypothetical protein
MKKSITILATALVLFAVTLYLTEGGTKTGKQLYKETFQTPDTVVVVVNQDETALRNVGWYGAGATQQRKDTLLQRARELQKH